MVAAPDRAPTLKRAAQHIFFGVGSSIASVVYGTVVVMATLTAAYATEKEPSKLAELVVAAVVALWVAHVYAHGLAETIQLNRRLKRYELTMLVRRELGIVLAAVGPVAGLLLGATGLLRETTAVWLALFVGLATLAAQGIRFARLKRLGLLGTIVATSVNLALGLIVVALKVTVAH